MQQITLTRMMAKETTWLTVDVGSFPKISLMPASDYRVR